MKTEVGDYLVSTMELPNSWRHATIILRKTGATEDGFPTYADTGWHRECWLGVARQHETACEEATMLTGRIAVGGWKPIHE